MTAILRDNKWWMLFALIFIGITTNFIPLPNSFKTVGAIGMLAAAYLPRSIIILPGLITVAIINILTVQEYPLLAVGIVYIAHIVSTVCIFPILRKIHTRTILSAAIISAIVFYLISNIVPMAMGYYPNTLQGWITAYVNGLEYLIRGGVSNIIFGLIFFALAKSIGEIRANRISTA